MKFSTTFNTLKNFVIVFFKVSATLLTIFIIFSLLIEFMLYVYHILFIFKETRQDALINDFSVSDFKTMLASLIFSIFFLFITFVVMSGLCLFLGILGVNKDKLNVFFKFVIRVNFSISIVLLFISSFNTVQIASILSVINIYVLTKKIKTSYFDSFEIMNVIDFMNNTTNIKHKKENNER